MHVYGRNNLASNCCMQSHGGPVNGADAPQFADVKLSCIQALPSSAQQDLIIGPQV